MTSGRRTRKKGGGWFRRSTSRSTRKSPFIEIEVPAGEVIIEGQVTKKAVTRNQGIFSPDRDRLMRLYYRKGDKEAHLTWSESGKIKGRLQIDKHSKFTIFDDSEWLQITGLRIDEGAKLNDSTRYSLKFRPKDKYVDWLRELNKIIKDVKGKSEKSRKSPKSRESPKSRKSPTSRKSPKSRISPKSEYSTKKFCNYYKCQNKTFKKCYREAALKTHPDRIQGKEEEFKKINNLNENNAKNIDKTFNENCDLNLK